MSEEDGPLIDALVNSKELAIFGTDLIIDLIDFRWKQFAGPIHQIGCAFHVAYILFLSLYINDIYLQPPSAAEIGEDTNYLWAVAIVLLYPLVYDGT